MITEQFFEVLLDFGDEWKVTKIEIDGKTDEVDIYVEYVGEIEIYDNAPERRWRHLDIMQFKTFIRSRLPRINQRKDGKVKTLSPPWADSYKRHSFLFENAVINLLLATMNQSQTANIMRCKFDVVNRIMHQATRRGLERRKESTEEVFEEISIDEKSFQKGHSYATVLSDPSQGRVLEVEQHRTLEACKKLIDKALTPEQQKAVKKISMDMWRAFIGMAQEKLPEAEIVHDKFHLIKYLNEAIDKVRRREVKEHEELKNSRYAMLKNEKNLTDQQRIKFEEIRDANYEVSEAWQARENFKKIFKNKGVEESKLIFQEWHKWVKKKEIKEVMKVAEMFSSHLRGVINAMTGSLSNAMAERLNGKIQLLKSIGRGYRKFENFRSAILFFYGKLELFPLN